MATLGEPTSAGRSATASSRATPVRKGAIVVLAAGALVAGAAWSPVDMIGEVLAGLASLPLFWLVDRLLKGGR